MVSLFFLSSHDFFPFFLSQQTTSRYKVVPAPISHNVRRSLNLENLSINERPWDELVQKPSLENERFATSEDIYPVTAIVAASSRFNKVQSMPQVLSTPKDANSNYIKQPLESIRCKTTQPLSEKGPMTSPSSTVSSRKNDVTFSHGQNTFNSTDSSGYSSSTLEVLDPSLKVLAISSSKLNPSILREETSECLMSGEDCPEDSASEFSFRLNPSKNDSTPIILNKDFPARLERNKRSLKSLNMSRHLTKSKSESVGTESTHTVKPELTGFRCPSSLTTSPPPIFQTEPLADPWLHRSQLSDSEQAVFFGATRTNFRSTSIPNSSDSASHSDKTRCILQRSKSERVGNKNTNFIPTLDKFSEEITFNGTSLPNSEATKSKVSI